MSEKNKEELYYFSWIVADLVGKKLKKKLRRKGWPEGWWIKYQDGFWLIERGSPDTCEIVRSSDFGEEDFYALDWTHLPPSCLPPEELGQDGCDKPLVYDDFFNSSDLLDELGEEEEEENSTSPQDDSRGTQNSQQNSSEETQNSQQNSSWEIQNSQSEEVGGAIWVIRGGWMTFPRPPRPRPLPPPFPNLIFSLQYSGLPEGPCANGGAATLPGNHTVEVVATVTLENGDFPAWLNPFLVQVYFRGKYWFSTYLHPGESYSKSTYSVFTPHSCSPWERVAYQGHATLYGYPVFGLGDKFLGVVSQEIEIPSYCTQL